MSSSAHSSCLRLLVTRPDPEGEVLCQLLQAQGDRPIHFPTIIFAPPHDPKKMHAAIATLGEQDWLIFASPRAVVATIPLLRAAWPIMPESVQWAAMGAGTAQALKEAGYVALYPRDDWRSEGLLALPTLQTVAGKKVTILTGEEGRTHLAETLTTRGATVQTIATYARKVPAIDATPVCHLLAKREVDAVIATSFDAIRHLRQLVGEISWEEVKRVPFIVVSERIQSLASALGLKSWVADNASHRAILNCIAEHRKTIWQMKS